MGKLFGGIFPILVGARNPSPPETKSRGIPVGRKNILGSSFYPIIIKKGRLCIIYGPNFPSEIARRTRLHGKNIFFIYL